MTIKIAYGTKQGPRNRPNLQLTELAQTKVTRDKKRKDRIRIPTWNVGSWVAKEQEVIQKLENHNIETRLLSETRRKGKGTTQKRCYLLVYSGVQNHVSAHADVGILIQKQYINYINERKLRISIKLDERTINILAGYAPHLGLGKKEENVSIKIYKNR